MTAEVLVHNDVLKKPTSQANAPELHGFPQQSNPVAQNK